MAKSKETAAKVIYRAQEDQIKSWHRNHKQPPVTEVSNSMGAPSSSGVLSLKQDAWEKYKIDWENTYPDTPIDITLFLFRNKFMRNHYAEQLDKVKAMVKEHRNKEKEDARKQNANFQSAIEKLSRTIVNFAASIYKIAGWHITLIMGGPVSADNGNISTIM
uniref:Uncharacterized protein n=1 Tax=Psilocybe cubensis TaxID=181762 RepID=A0A8H7XMN0_PSICU